MVDCCQARDIEARRVRGGHSTFDSKLHRAALRMWTTFSDNPIFGVDFDVEEHVESIAEVTVPRREDDVEIDDEEVSDALAAYYADGAGDAGDADARPPAVHPVLELAIEQPPERIRTAVERSLELVPGRGLNSICMPKFGKQ